MSLQQLGFFFVGGEAGGGGGRLGLGLRFRVSPLGFEGLLVFGLGGKVTCFGFRLQGIQGL